MRVGNHPLPTLVIESGWSESLDRLREKARLWLAGGNATAVIVICWRSVANTDQVEGEVELYILDGNGSLVLRQTEIGFPEPPPEQGRVQSIRLTRWMVLGSTISSDRDPDDPFDLRIDDLTWAAARALGFMDLVPASFLTLLIEKNRCIYAIMTRKFNL